MASRLLALPAEGNSFSSLVDAMACPGAPYIVDVGQDLLLAAFSWSGQEALPALPTLDDLDAQLRAFLAGRPPAPLPSAPLAPGSAPFPGSFEIPVAVYCNCSGAGVLCLQEAGCFYCHAGCGSVYSLDPAAVATGAAAASLPSPPRQAVPHCPACWSRTGWSIAVWPEVARAQFSCFACPLSHSHVEVRLAQPPSPLPALACPRCGQAATLNSGDPGDPYCVTCGVFVEAPPDEPGAPAASSPASRPPPAACAAAPAGPRGCSARRWPPSCCWGVRWVVVDPCKFIGFAE